MSDASLDRGARLFCWQAYGGLGEVGMNCMVFRFGNLAVPVDAGILFADPNDFGIEAVSTDYAPILEAYRPPAWIFTHAHEDHIGAAAAVLSAAARLGIEPPRLLAPRFAAALIRERLADDPRHPRARRFADRVEVLEKDSKLPLSPDLDVYFIETRHSTPDSCSIGFEWRSPEGPLRVIHTADFKLDPGRFEDGVRDVSAYGVFGDAPTDFLFVDSTNAERAGHSVSELDVIAPLERLISEAEGRVFVTLFSSNVYRVAALIGAAGRCGRYATVAGRSLQTAFRLGMDLSIFDDCPSFDETRLLNPNELSRQMPSKQLIVCSGSQGEFRSVLWKLALDEHPEYTLEPGDTVILSSKTIPGNEKSVGRLINGLLRRGAKVVWGEEAKAAAGGPIHASGHARSEEIRELIGYLKPRQVVPIHGELRMLQACARLAVEEGKAWGLTPSDVHVVENGIQLAFERVEGRWRLSRRDHPYEPPKRLLRFENFVTGTKDPFLRVRKRAAQGGCLVVSLDSGGRYRISADGVWPEEPNDVFDRERLLSEIEGWVFARFKTLRRLENASYGDAMFEAEIADDLGRYVRKISGLRPHVVFHWMEQG